LLSDPFYGTVEITTVYVVVFIAHHDSFVDIFFFVSEVVNLTYWDCFFDQVLVLFDQVIKTVEHFVLIVDVVTSIHGLEDQLFIIAELFVLVDQVHVYILAHFIYLLYMIQNVVMLCVLCCGY